MIRQAHTYLVGALSGVVVIGIAIAAFVVLVSAQVFHDLPIPALSSSDQKPPAVSQGKALSSPDHRAVATTGGVSIGTTQPDHTTANANAAGGGQAGANNSQSSANHQATPTPTQDATAPAEVVETSSGNGTGNQGSSSNGGNAGSHNSQPSTSHQPSSSNGGSGGGTTTSTSGSTGGGAATGTSGPTTTSPPPTPVTTAKPSEAITESVNGAVGTVDDATGGALSESGVTPVVEEAVNGVAGPESVVGKTVDGVGEVVGGLVGGSGQ
jgi:hypothetical protein